MTNISRSHLISFEGYFRSLPEVQKYVDDGIEVLESFKDDEGKEHYCHQYTQDALEKWLLENPEDQRDIRKEFVDEITAVLKRRRDITLYRYFGFDVENPPVRNKAAEELYMAGVRDAIDNIISITDDRSLNGAKWRLTTTEGDVVSFCNPKDKEYLETPGLIALFHNAISS